MTNSSAIRHLVVTEIRRFRPPINPSLENHPLAGKIRHLMCHWTKQSPYDCFLLPTDRLSDVRPHENTQTDEAHHGLNRRKYIFTKLYTKFVAKSAVLAAFMCRQAFCSLLLLSIIGPKLIFDNRAPSNLVPP